MQRICASQSNRPLRIALRGAFFHHLGSIAEFAHSHSLNNEKLIGSTHTGELDATVTALGSSALLLDVEVPELTAGGLDDADLVGPRVVPIDEIPSISCL